MNKKLIYSILSVALTFVIASCSDSYLDINNNPNQAVSATPETVLANALNVTAGRTVHHEIGAFWAGQWSPSGSVSGFTSEKTYDIQTTFRTGIWTSPYNNLTDYKYVEQQAVAQGKLSIAGMARVMKAFNYQILVDAYGNLPYSDALKGTTSIRPKYDDAKVVYDSLIRDINIGIQYLNQPITSVNASAGSSDLFFGGSNAKWIKFANTLKLRMLLRLSGVADQQALIAAEMASFGTDHEAFLSTGENVKSNPGYLKTSGKENQWYEFYGYTSADTRAGNHDFYAWSNYFLKTLQDLNDPRISLLAYPVGGSGSTYLGVPFGDGNDTYLYSKISGFGPSFLPLDNTVKGSSLFKRDQIVMPSAESFFLQAEAVQRGLLVSDFTAKTLYEMGIKESFDLLASQSDAKPNMIAEYNAYINSSTNDVNWSASPNKIEAIIVQKWIALANYEGFEAWNEYKRTGFPAVPLSTRAISTKIPVRLLYPQSEYNNNAENVGQQGSINQFDSRIFWDVN
jgi:hypothetical protein